MTSDPRTSQPTSFPGEPQQPSPGLVAEMKTKPDHGEESYVGKGLLKGKVALITGGDSGIGKAVAIAYAREGADVAISYLAVEQADAEDTRAWVEKAGQRCVLLPGDLRCPEYCESLVAQTVAQFGKLNIVVSNAAEQFVNTNVAELPHAQFEDTFQVNFFALLRVVKATLPHLHAGDSIIATSSINAYRGNQQLVDYTSTKGAIEAFTRALSLQLVKKGIRVNSVAPGPIWTPFVTGVGLLKLPLFGHDVPMGRAGQPSEVAPSYVFLASEDASYFSGQTLHPNGGSVVNA